MTVTIPIRLVSLLNSREHWAKKAKRAKAQRQAVANALILSRVERPALPCVVTITRVAPRQLDDDNLAASGKSTRDQVAAWLGVDDKPGSGVEWRYAQRKGGRAEYACEIRIEEEA
jgi:hypothetical protein